MPELLEKSGRSRRGPPLLSARGVLQSRRRSVAPDKRSLPVLSTAAVALRAPCAPCAAPASASTRPPASPLAPPPERQAAADRGAHEDAGAAAALAASPVSGSDPKLPGHDGGMSTDGESPEDPGWKAVASPKAAAMPEKRGSAQAAGGSWVGLDWVPAGTWNFGLF